MYVHCFFSDGTLERIFKRERCRLFLHVCLAANASRKLGLRQRRYLLVCYLFIAGFYRAVLAIPIQRFTPRQRCYSRRQDA